MTPPWPAVMVWTTLIMRMSVTRSVLSRDPERSHQPLGFHAVVRTQDVCPGRFLSSLPLLASQSLTMLSLPEEARRDLAGCHATDVTFALWPVRTRSSTRP